MTIKVEREALITVLNRAPSWPLSPCEALSIRSGDDEFVLVNLPTQSSCLDVDYLRSPTFSDDDSLCTLSTASDSLSTDSSLERRVSFAPSLVSDEWTRPFTEREEVTNLFYSTEDTNRFRHEYRLERKALNELSIHPNTSPVNHEELSTLMATTRNDEASSGRHNISRVVVVHKNKFETFFNPNEALQEKEEQALGGDFFDHDSFWSGSLTWY